MNLLEPFTGGWQQISIWYFGTLIIMLLLSAFFKHIGFLGDEFEDKSALYLIVFGVVLLPTAEEYLFRGIPFAVFGSLQALGIGTILWVLAHGRRAIVIAPSGLFYFKLWATAMGLEAMIIHTVHNAIFIAIYLIGRRRKRQNITFSPRSIDL